MIETIKKPYVTMKNSRGDYYGFNFFYQGVLPAETDVIVIIPEVTSNKRSINDIGWMTNGSNIKVYGTISENPESNKSALWQEISPTEDVNKVCTALKFENNGESEATISVRAIMC